MVPWSCLLSPKLWALYRSSSWRPSLGPGANGPRQTSVLRQCYTTTGHRNAQSLCCALIILPGTNSTTTVPGDQLRGLGGREAACSTTANNDSNGNGGRRQIRSRAFESIIVASSIEQSQSSARQSSKAKHISRTTTLHYTTLLYDYRVNHVPIQFVAICVASKLTEKGCTGHKCGLVSGWASTWLMVGYSCS